MPTKRSPAVIVADTNVVVRVLTGADSAQAARARLLFETEMVFLPKSVMLETEWVLRRLYRKGKQEVAGALGNLAALPSVRCEDEAAVLQALAWSRQGLDFADALHLASSHTAVRFATFDRTLVRGAASAAVDLTVSEP